MSIVVGNVILNDAHFAKTKENKNSEFKRNTVGRVASCGMKSEDG